MSHPDGETSPSPSFQSEILHLEDILNRCARLLETSTASKLNEELLAIRAAARSVNLSLRSRALAPPVMREEFSPQERLRILLVEDNLVTQKLMARLLEQHRHRVRVVENGLQAMAALDEETFDLVLMDLRMPNMDGWQTATAIRFRESDRGGGRLPIIAVTSLTGHEERLRAMETGMDGFHGKPVRADALFAEIERVLHRPLPPPSPPRAPPSPEEVRVDVDRLMQSVDGDASLLREVVELYRNDAPRLLDLIQEGIASGNAPQIREAAHSLKGATGAFGKNQVYQLAFALEQAGQAGELARARELLPQLHFNLDRMNETLDRTLANLAE